MSSTNYSISSEDIASGAPGYIAPLSAGFSPDGSKLTYLFPDERGVRKVIAVDLPPESFEASGGGAGMSSDSADGFDMTPYKLFDLSAEGTMSLQEQLRRERMRLFTSGISSYEWCSKANTGVDASSSTPMEIPSQCLQKMIVPMNGKIVTYSEYSVLGSVSNSMDDGNSPNSPSMRPAPTATGERLIASLVDVLYDGEVGDAVDPHLSPDGTMVAFVVADDLYVMHIETRRLQRLTAEGAAAGITCGLADFIAQEEMDRYRGFWWSPDSKHIVYAKADETNVPEYEIRHLGKSDPTHSETHRYPFAGQINPLVTLGVVTVPVEILAASKAAGEGDSIVSDAASVPPTQWLDLVDPADDAFTTIDALGVSTKLSTMIDYYVGRVGWWPDGTVMVQIQNRSQSVLQLLRVDINSGARIVMIQEDRRNVSSAAALEESAIGPGLWVNLHDMLHCFPPTWRPAAEWSRNDNADDFYFLWASERTSFMQLYFYKYDAAAGVGKCLAGEMTPVGCKSTDPAPQFVVESVNAVDEDRCLVYFSGNKDNDIEKHLFCANFLPKGGDHGILKITVEAGWHSCAVQPSTGFVMDTFNAATVPVRCRLYRMMNLPISPDEDLQSKHFEMQFLTELLDCEKRDPRLARNSSLKDALIAPYLKTIRSSDDKVDLHCAVYLPPGAIYPDGRPNKSVDNASPKYPAIVSVYGGPHVQRVQNNWLASADLRAQRLAQSGFVVIKCDNRGSYRRGLEFEGALYKDMGNVEVKDQVSAVDHFAGLGLIDKTRVGMFGWSYGGYMSAMSLCRAPDSFSCAVAGAPVTSWDGYDTHYTERYMGLPQENTKGYNDSSVMSHTGKMKGNLLLVHGLIDENVHFRHTARLINALIAQRKRYELVLFPCERHSPHKMQDKIYMEDIIMDFFKKHLQLTSESEAVPMVTSAAGTANTATGMTSSTLKMTSNL